MTLGAMNFKSMNFFAMHNKARKKLDYLRQPDE